MSRTTAMVEKYFGGTLPTERQEGEPDTELRTMASTLRGLPKLFAHSTNDEVIPFQSGRILHAAAAAPKTFALLSGAHNDSSWFTPGALGNAELEAFLAPIGR